MKSLKTQALRSSTQPRNSTAFLKTIQSQNTKKLDKNKIKNRLTREALVSWLFLIGSLMFVLDGILENINGISFSSLLHLSASILFTIGSILFIPSSSENDLENR